MNELFRHDNDFRIQDLTVENPKQRTESPFDPEQSISEADWQAILAYIEHANGSSETEYFANVDRALILFPERHSDLKLSSETEQRVKRYAVSFPSNTDDETYLRASLLKLARGRMLFPQALDYDSYYPAFRRQTRAYFSQSDRPPDSLAHMASLFRQAFPREADPLLMEHWPQLLTHCQNVGRVFADYPFIEVDEYTNILHRLRLAYPDRSDALKATSTHYWPVAKANLDEMREFPDELLAWAVKLKTVAAEKIIVDENGVQLILGAAKPDELTEDLPEQRRY